MDEQQLEQQEEALLHRLERLRQQEEEIRKLEAEQKRREKAKKQVLLRLAPSLWQDIAAWAEEDFRSINGQIEYLLKQAVEQHKKKNCWQGRCLYSEINPKKSVDFQ